MKLFNKQQPAETFEILFRILIIYIKIKII